jgi:methane/ammonia monooxygenase subunit C
VLKGKQVKIPVFRNGLSGNTRDSGSIGHPPGKSYLFFNAPRASESLYVEKRFEEFKSTSSFGVSSVAQMPALIPKEVEIQRLKKIYIMVIMLGSIAASVEVDNFVDGSLHQTAIRDSAFTPAHWWLYSHFIALPLGWGFVAMYDRRVPILRGPNNSMNTGLKLTILGYLATMFTIGVNEMWHFWFVEEIFSVPNHWMFNMGVVVAFMGALAYVVRVYARLVELGAETPAKNPYVAEMYKLALEGKLYSRSIP